MHGYLREILTAEERGRGAASVSVIQQHGDEPQTVWVPESKEEPAFLVYSLTKTFTAALVLMLVAKGKLRLDDPLAKWFPRIIQAERISVRQLLNHTAGIPDYGGILAYHHAVSTSPSRAWSFERFAAETFEKGLLFTPGSGWAYSNPAYMLLKRIVEEVAASSYRDLVADRIAKPLGLSRTFVPEATDDLAGLASGTSVMLASDGSRRDVRDHYHPGWVSHGVVASTSSEITRFFDKLFQGELLPGDARSHMTEFVEVGLGPNESTLALRPGRPSYGLGVMGDPASPWGLIVGHNGAGPCYSGSAFHAFQLGGASVCAMGAIEEDFRPAKVVADVLDQLVA